MPTDEAALTDLRQTNAHLAVDYRRQIAVIERRLKALEDRAFVADILNATIGKSMETTGGGSGSDPA